MKGYYDIIICGGGLAGQTLARQLKINHPDVSVLMLIKDKFPMPVATCKVGESTVEIAGFYFAESLCLHDYFKNNHFTKMGLRYFYSNDKPFSERPEIGLSSFSPYDSFQIDRGIFENDLYNLNIMEGVEMVENVSVKDIELSKSKALHEVSYIDIDSKNETTVKGKWVIDAMGRRNFLQKKLDLKIPVEKNCNSAWFRVDGRLDVDDFVSRDDKNYHQRVGHKSRYFSTTHLMGTGYWVWIIPLASGKTSVGIVTYDEIHPFATYNTQRKAFEWLEKYETTLFDHVRGLELLDFKLVRNFASKSKQIFSEDRWACVGDAAMFSDAFYSPGSNLIGFENSIVTKMVGLDMNNKLYPDTVARFNDFAISHNDWLIETVHQAYSYFGEEHIMSLNYLWDIVTGWAIIAPNMFNDIYLDDMKSREIRKVTATFSSLSVRVKQLFKEWEKVTNRTFTFKFIDYLSVPFVKEIYKRNLSTGKSIDELVEDMRQNVVVLENFARAIFLLAIEDAFPDKMDEIDDFATIDGHAVSLRPEVWTRDGLFEEGKMINRELFDDIRTQLVALYHFKGKADRVEQSLETTFSFDF